MPAELPNPSRLSATLKAVRRARGLRPPEVAQAMGLPLRSYERFEAGAGRMDWGRLQAFAQATRSDPLALFLAVVSGSPTLAVRCADHKLVSLWQMALEEFHATAGEGVKTLDAAFILDVFTGAFESLAEEIKRRQATAEAADSDPEG
ncbi:helix-turn-helix domain-containing protein [Brevundimonas staleyi]|uniref:Helix-turn-helix domain-containing protein n=1 Tax=Brevundimonas staleyi TaxID=74326 RepID=A0ABW0FWT6_9CAUL